MNKIKNMGQKGFTLIEIMMAVLIIVILAVVGITQFANFAADAKNAATKSNLAILRNAIGTMNALERVRCGKTSLQFPDPATLQTNDITNCVAATAAPTAAACDFNNLFDPATGAHYVDCTISAPYMALIPLIDRPYVQNAIPDNPWTSTVEIKNGSVANYVSADIQSGNTANLCAHTPVYVSSGVLAANARKCGAASTGAGPPLLYVSPFDGVSGAAPALGIQGEGGWCYCKYTGQIWANSGNNNGLGDGAGIESRF